MPAELDDLKTEVTTLKANYAHTESNVAELGESRKTLTSDVEKLKQDRAKLLGFIAAMTAFGILGAGFVVYLTTQLTGLNKEIGKASELLNSVEEKLKVAFDKDQADLQKTFNDDKADLQKTAKDSIRQLAPEVFPELNQKITFLDTTEIKPFVEHYGEISPSGPQDDRIQNITESGIIQDCNGMGIPSQARGCVVWVIIARPSTDGSAHFLSSDSRGNLQHYGVSNYSKIWAGGIAFCRFYEGQKFKWSVVSNDRPKGDPRIGCIGNIIGWF